MSSSILVAMARSTKCTTVPTLCLPRFQEPPIQYTVCAYFKSPA